MQRSFIPHYLYQSRLQKQGGYEVFAGLLPLDLYQAMVQEAQNLLPYAQESNVTAPDFEDVRGGNPPRAFLSVPAGPVQQSFYHSPALRSFLGQVTGLSVQLSGIQGTYSFYARAGDHLSLHRDVKACDLAVITCLQDQAPASSRGGLLCLYPGRCEEPLSQIRATPDQGCTPVQLAPNHTIVLYGGIVPHLVRPVIYGQARTVSILCFSAQE